MSDIGAHIPLFMIPVYSVIFFKYYTLRIGSKSIHQSVEEKKVTKRYVIPHENSG